MIRRCNEVDLEAIWSIINDGARAYSGVIPADRCSDPYMPLDKLRYEIADGVEFWGYDVNSLLAGVMGIQHVQDVMLIRHAYVRTANQHQGIGARLLAHLRTLSEKPFLIGTWADALWAIRFYERYGFSVVDLETKGRLLRTYWKIPERQVETSVVLVDERWRSLRSNEA